MRIVIVEDEEDIRTFLKKAIEVYDPELELIEADNGMEAVRMVAKEEPDGAILDMLMPDMDGWEFLEITEALNVKLPIVILTAIRRDNASLCSVMTSYENVISIENKPLDISDVGRILDLLKDASKTDSA